jgi:hypothetical protein
MNLVVIAFEMKELVLDLVLENRVMMIPSADQVNFAVTVVKVILANVVHLALENRVSMITTAYQVNFAVTVVKIVLANVIDRVL